ncbi:hypothetical protein PtB15_1B900 [Puccinia triticina]|nr:hypothetical protein PtB15_1B900 [Puccinia triticina]
MISFLLSCIAFLDLPTIVLSHGSPSKLYTRQAVVRPNALRNFEIREPPVVPRSKACEQLLLTHTFSNSYGKPAHANYLPPADCGQPGDWASVIFNMTITSVGKQYDRLGRLYFNDIEIWRTSTAEPTVTGVIWTVNRDVSKYIPLLSYPGSLSLDIGNIVDKSTNLTGSFEVTLSAKFYPPTQQFPTSKKVDKIINMGRGIGHNMTHFLTFPQNLEAAFLEVFASGSGQEEFWFTNVPDQYTGKIDPEHTGNIVTAKGAFREVQVWIDNRLAGVAYPFPVIYTGGILMSWWRPIAGIGAFDAPTYIIDISPFVPYLSDSNAHNFTLVVEGQGEKHSINPDWIFSGSVFMTLDPSGARTTGEMIAYSTDSNTTVEPSAGASKLLSDVDPSCSINFLIKSYRKLSVSSLVITGSGEPRVVSVEQDYNYMNEQSWLPRGDYQSVVLSSQGTSISTSDDMTTLSDSFEFPLNLNLSTIASSNQTTIIGNLTHSFRRSQFLSLSPSLGQVEIDTTQISIGELKLNAKGRVAGGLGRTAQSFVYKDGRNESYTRNIEVYNVTNVIRDEESGSLSSPRTSDLNVITVLPNNEDDIQGCPIRILCEASFEKYAKSSDKLLLLQTNQ